MTAVLSRRSARRYVLDANALSGFFEDREGTAGKIEKLLGEALSQDLAILMSAVNWGEVFYVAWRRHGETYAWQAEARLGELPIAVIAADREPASRAGAFKPRPRLGSPDAPPAAVAIE